MCEAHNLADSIWCEAPYTVECVKLLLEHGADINIKENYGWTALHMACRYCNEDSSIECVKLLLEHGADVNAKENDGWTALHLACRYCNEDSSIECVKLLLEHGADINIKNIYISSIKCVMIISMLILYQGQREK